MEYKPVQKKNASWTPTTVQKKGKSPGKMGHFPIQPKSNPSSAPSQEIGEYSRSSADRLTANVMRGIQAKELEQAEGSTLQRKSESPWAPTFDAPPPIPQSPASQLKGAFAPVSENPIQRQCADCAKQEEEQAGEAGKDLEEIGIQTKLTIGAPGDADLVETLHATSLQVMSMSAPADSSASVQRQLGTNNPNQIWQRAQSIKPVMQRQIDPRVQMRQMIQRAHQIDGNQASGDVESHLNASQCDRKNSLIQRFSWSEVTETAGQIGNKITDAASSVGEQVERGVNYLTSRPERQRAERERPERERENQDNFCTPYSSRAEVYAAKTYLWTTLIPSATGMFGMDVAGLWQQYLSGASSGYQTFAKGSNIANAFAKCNVIRQRTENLIAIAINRTDIFKTLTANRWVDVPVNKVFTPAEINYGINFSNPYDIPGHIAGGIGSSSFGADTRTLKGYLSVYRETDYTGKTIGYQLKSKFEFEVKDTVDFCPGQPGSALEQSLTIPASRLEASGEAFDVPFEVQFAAPEIIQTIGLTSTGVSSDDNSDRRHRTDRQDVGRGSRRRR